MQGGHQHDFEQVSGKGKPLSNKALQLWHSRCLLPEFTEQAFWLHLIFYLYHDVNVLAILQQTQIGIEVEPVVLGAGVSQDHLTVSKGLK